MAKICLKIKFSYLCVMNVTILSFFDLALVFKEIYV